MRLVPIEYVGEDSYLAQTIFDNSGRILLQAGEILSKTRIKKIQQLNIFSVYISDSYNKHEFVNVIKPQLRQKSISLMKETFNFFESIDSPSNSKLSPTQKLRHELEHIAKVENLSEELLDNISKDTTILLSLVDIKSMDNYTYQHSVNVAILSIIFGINLKLPRQKLKEICIGALLHDIGKALTPKDIIVKPSALTKEEFEIMKLHSKKGYDYLGSNHSIKNICKIIALQHHERIDGLGYPFGLDGDKIHLYSKIVSIADVYDALTSDRPYRRALCANDALEYIMANVGTAFDFDLVKIFSSTIVPFPNGTILKLSNGDKAMALKTLPGFPLRPFVKILDSSQKERINTELNLIEKLSVTITEVLYN